MSDGNGAAPNPEAEALEGISSPSAQTYSQTSSSVQFESGNTRTCSPGRCRPL